MSAAEVDTIMAGIASMESGIRQNIKDHFLGGTQSSDGWRPGATKLIIENQRRINTSDVKLAGLEAVVGQLAKGQGMVIDYAKVDASIKKSLADGIEITGSLVAKDGIK